MQTSEGLTQVVLTSDHQRYWLQSMDLQRSTVQRHVGEDMRFCYYREVNARDVYAGLRTARGLRVFVKLRDNEPMDLSLDDWLTQWRSFPEEMPDADEVSEPRCRRHKK